MSLKLNFVIAIAISTIVSLSSCKKEDVDEAPDEYYVKFDVNSSTIYSGGKLEVILKNENNQTKTFLINQKVLWEVVIGPVEKGFLAEMNVKTTGNSQDKLTLYTNIYVSKNGSPFAIKETNGSDTPRDEASISYTIDY